MATDGDAAVTDGVTTQADDQDVPVTAPTGEPDAGADELAAEAEKAAPAADTGKRVVPPAGKARVRPEQTTDDTDAGWGERRDESGHDRWLQEQRPPHWE